MHARLMSKALTMKAPVASGMVTPWVTANTAAPGVDQTVNIGWRYQRLNTKLVPPIPKPSAPTGEQCRRWCKAR